MYSTVHHTFQLWKAITRLNCNRQTIHEPSCPLGDWGVWIQTWVVTRADGPNVSTCQHSAHPPPGLHWGLSLSLLGETLNTVHYNTISLLLKVSENWNFSLLIYGRVLHKGCYELLLELWAAAGATSCCWSYKLLLELQATAGATATVTNWVSDMSWIFIIFNRYRVFSNQMKNISENSSRRNSILKLSKATMVSENKR